MPGTLAPVAADDLRLLHRIIWSDALLLRDHPECVTQQICNQLPWCHLLDPRLEEEARRAVGRAAAMGRPLLLALLPPASGLASQRVTASDDRLIFAGASADGFWLISRSGSCRLIDQAGDQVRTVAVSGTFFQQAHVAASAAVLISGRLLRCWSPWPDREAARVQLPFVSQHIRLSAAGTRVMAFGPNGEWTTLSVEGAALRPAQQGRLSEPVSCCALDALGKTWAAGTQAGNCHIGMERQVRSVRGPGSPIQACDVSRDGRRIAFGTRAGVIRVLDSDGIESAAWDCGTAITWVGFGEQTADLFVAAEDGTFTRYDLGPTGGLGKETWLADTAPLIQASVAPSGECAVVLNASLQATIVRKPARLSVDSLSIPSLGTVSFAADFEGGRSLLAVDDRGQVFSLSLADRLPRINVLHQAEGSVVRALLSPSQDSLLLVRAGTLDAQVIRQVLHGPSYRDVLWPQPAGGRAQEDTKAGAVLAAAFSRDGRTLVLACMTESPFDPKSMLTLVDTATGDRLRSAVVDGYVRVAAVANGGRRVFIGFADEQPPRALDWTGASPQWSQIPIRGCRAIDTCASGERAAVVDSSDRLWWWEGGTNLPYVAQAVSCCALDDEGRRLLYGEHSGRIAYLPLPGHAGRPAWTAVPWIPKYCRIDSRSTIVFVGGRGVLQAFRPAEAG
jgi:hypothetical protein